MNVDKFFYREYNYKDYNCLHFLCDVWKEETGKDISKYLLSELGPLKDRKIRKEDIRNFTPLKNKESPCIVVMTRPRCDPHVGMYYEGRILHITPSGVQFLPESIATAGFSKIRYYK